MELMLPLPLAHRRQPARQARTVLPATPTTRVPNSNSQRGGLHEE